MRRVSIGKNGHRSATIGARGRIWRTWSGVINDEPSLGESDGNNWKFQLRADHLDAADLDLWFGPRARPNWLQRLLPSLLANPMRNAKPANCCAASRRRAPRSRFPSIEKIKLAKARAHITFHDLHMEVRDARSRMGGGTARGSFSAVFSVPPKYGNSAEVDRAEVSELPWSAHWGEHWAAPHPASCT